MRIRPIFTRLAKAPRRYNENMARGWESKSVEAQIEESDIPPSPFETPHLSPEELQAEFKKNDLMLSRRGILQQLERSNSERYSELLRRALTDLDAQIAELA
jgi:hypothetical protein